jgi:hypothetical protein
MFHGRWKSMESARRYIQTGRALLVSLDLPAALHQTGSELASVLVPVLQSLTVSAAPASAPSSSFGQQHPQHVHTPPQRKRRVRFLEDC